MTALAVWYDVEDAHGNHVAEAPSLWLAEYGALVCLREHPAYGKLNVRREGDPYPISSAVIGPHGPMLKSTDVRRSHVVAGGARQAVGILADSRGI